jgi:hypothetical protein
MLGSGIWLSCPLVAEVISLYVPFLMAALTGDTGTLHSSILNVPLGTISYGARCLSAYSPNRVEKVFCELPRNTVKRKFALLGRCIESSMVPSFTGGSLGKEEKVETHLAQLD